MLMLAVLVLTLTPAAVLIDGWRQSKILLLSMKLLVLLFGLADPSDITPLVGRLAPAGPMLLLVMKLPLFAPPVEVLIRMSPPAMVVVDVDEPSTVQFVMLLFWAPLMRRIVLVPAVAEAVVFESVSELPPVFSPLMLAFFAPFKLISGLPAVIAPVTVRAPLGSIATDV